MAKTDFDKSKVLDYVIQNLRNKHLLPKPHLGVLETKWPEISVGTFTYSDRPASQNIIGYDFIIKEEGSSPQTKTVFNFCVRSGDIRLSEEKNEDSFAQLQLDITTNLKESSSKITIKNLKTNEVYKEENMIKFKDVGTKSFFRTTFEKEFVVNYKEFGKDIQSNDKNPIKLSIIKNIKKESEGIYRVQLRIINEKDNESFKNVGIKQGDSEKYQKVPKGILLDFDIQEQCDQAKFNIQTNRWGTKTSIKRLFNLIAQKESVSQIDFKEYFRGFETIPKFKEGKPKKQFISNLKNEGIEIEGEVVDAFPHINSFYHYQEEGIQKIAREIKEKKGEVNIISVRTAGGKTETFTVPIINYCLKNLDKIGTKAIIFYPTKALANDQAARIFKALYFLNQSIKKQGKRPLTMGIYHGDIKKTSKEEKELWIPFKCPNPNCESPIIFEEVGINNIARCSKCGENLDYLILTRYEIHKKIPDILITNQDTLHYTLMKQPQHHSIFGRSINYCDKCGESFINKRVCPDCHKDLVKVNPLCSPEIIVMDEIHMLGGAFGMNTSMFLKRLKNTIKVYTKNENYKPTFIGATATIDNPDKFGKQLFSNSNINMIPFDKNAAYEDEKELTSKGELIKREHLFILPRSYNSADTLSFGMHYILKYFAENIKEKPSVLGFCESIKDNRSLIKLTNSRKPKIEGKNFIIRGHTSQFERDLRAEIEKKFTKKEIDVLYATSTLEVGVDFDDINVLLLHGAPYSFNDYLQRVGRSGRKKDAIVITTLRKWSHLDYYYFEKCRSMLENPDEFVVDPPFSDKNEVIFKNHLRALFFDYLSTLPNTEKIYGIKELKEFISKEGSKEISKEFKEKFKEFIKNCFGSSLEEGKLFDEVLEEFAKEIFTNSEVRDLDELFNVFEEKYQIGKLRTADKTVEVVFQI